jgi:spore coat-associated protein N
MKKKIGLGVASAALGLSLIGGGTFAYFNDTATINNTFASGTLDLSVLPYSGSYPINFDLSNMKPGDGIDREFKLDNTGTLAIQNVWMNMTAAAGDYVNANGASMDEFLDQFEVDVFRIKKGVDNIWGPEIRLFKEDVVTLKDLANATDLTAFVNDANVLSSDKKSVDLAYGGLSVDPDEEEYVRIYINFVNNGDQNEFQNTTAKFQFNLEATQHAGQNVEKNRDNGYLQQNEKDTQIQNPSIDTTRQDGETDVQD